MVAPDASVRIRRVGPDDGLMLRDLRLRSLRDSPEAFGQTVDEALAQSDADWAAAARAAAEGDRRAWFISEAAGRADGHPATRGVVMGRRRPPHTLLIFSMWVDPAARRSGVGRQLIDATEAWATGWGALRSVLWVFTANDAAVRFYLRLGYRVEPDGDDARTGARYGALAMSRPLRGPRLPRASGRPPTDVPPTPGPVP